MPDPSASSSPAFLAALTALQDSGVACTEGDSLARILELLQAQIITAVTVESEAFDRGRYERLLGLWQALETERASA